MKGLAFLHIETIITHISKKLKCAQSKHCEIQQIFHWQISHYLDNSIGAGKYVKCKGLRDFFVFVFFQEVSTGCIGNDSSGKMRLEATFPGLKQKKKLTISVAEKKLTISVQLRWSSGKSVGLWSCTFGFNCESGQTSYFN